MHTRRLVFISIIIFYVLELSSQLSINEINYRSPDKQFNIEFIEIYNAGQTAVDISGWAFSEGIDFEFPPNSILPALTYIVVVADAQAFSNQFPQVTANIYSNFQGSLANDGETIRLVDANCFEIDKVDFNSWQEWPNVRYANSGNAPLSIQKINHRLPGKHGGSWASDVPSPGEQNSTVFVNQSSEVVVIESVSKSPDKPHSNEAVRIKVDVSKHESSYQGSANLKLEYQINNPGDYKSRTEIYLDNSLWTSIQLLDNGLGPDSVAQNSIYTAEIPASVQVHRRLVRYRIKLTQPNGVVRYFPDPSHTEMNYAYYVYDAYAPINGYDVNQLEPLQDITIISQSSVVNYFIGQDFGGNNGGNQYQGTDYLGKGTLVYNGKVYDHIRFRPRGKGSRTVRDKPGIKIDLNNERGIIVQDDCGDDYKQQRDKIMLSGTWVNDVASHGLTESIIYKLTELTGGLPRNTDYAQLRIVDKAQETGNAGDFWGVFLILEEYEGDYLKEHKLAEGNFWSTNVLNRFRVIDYTGDFPNASSTPTFAPYNYDGPFTIDARGHLPLLFGDRIANELYGQNGENYVGKHSYKEYYDSASNKYLGWWSDMDNAFGSPFDDVTVFPRAQADFNAPNANLMHIPAEYQIDFKNQFRSTYDLLYSYTDPSCNCKQTDFLIDQESQKIFDPHAAFDWAAVDQSRWSQTYDLGSFSAHQQWYKTWFNNRENYLLAQFADIDIPNQPTIAFTGQTALDQMTLSNSAFIDPNGNQTFAALEWRVGEWSDPSNSYYDLSCDAKYEVTTKWTSGEISTFSTTYQIPPEAKLKEDRTYLIRVRYQDTTGRWSHWSEPVKVVPTAAINPLNYDVVINEIMYNPIDPIHAEFIEIYNNGTQAIDLSHLQFTEGIDFEFSSGDSLAVDSFICLAEDSIAFYKSYGFYPDGEYKSQLSNKGELLRLVGPYRTIVDTVKYNDKLPWPETPDKGMFSLALKNPQMDNALATSWGIQSSFVTPGTENQFINVGDHAYSGIVINEIHYNPFDSVDHLGNIIESGSEFEFIELKNISNAPIDMSGAFFSRGITYEFEVGTVIQADGFFVLAEDNSSFTDRYGFVADGKYGGKLSNGGESIWLNQADGTVMDVVDYSNTEPWDTTANAGLEDLSLALIDQTADNNSRVNWQTQCSAAYTPGQENDFSCFEPTDYMNLTINEIHFNPVGGAASEYIEIVNHSTTAINLKSVVIFGGIHYEFDEFNLPPKTNYPDNYLVIAKDSLVFLQEFGFSPHDQYSGELNNAGELLVMQDLFGNVIDLVDFRYPFASSPTEESLALIDLALDNSTVMNWCVQVTTVTPKSINQFNDADNDGVPDCVDQCPGLQDQLAGTACDDGNDCTVGDVYDQTCSCVSGPYLDSDTDGVCDANDLCPGFDDTIDIDNNGIPDGCDGCVDEVIQVDYSIISVDTSAAVLIQTNGLIDAATTITYKAGQEIEFMPGFEVVKTAVFHALIEDCSN